MHLSSLKASKPSSKRPCLRWYNRKKVVLTNRRSITHWCWRRAIYHRGAILRGSSLWKADFLSSTKAKRRRLCFRKLHRAAKWDMVPHVVSPHTIRTTIAQTIKVRTKIHQKYVTQQRMNWECRCSVATGNEWLLKFKEWSMNPKKKAKKRTILSRIQPRDNPCSNMKVLVTLPRSWTNGHNLISSLNFPCPLNSNQSCPNPLLRIPSKFPTQW